MVRNTHGLTPSLITLMKQKTWNIIAEFLRMLAALIAGAAGGAGSTII